MAPSAHDVVPFLELVDQPGKVGRVILAVAVQGGNQLAPGEVEAGGQGRRLAEVRPEPDDPEGGEPGGQRE